MKVKKILFLAPPPAAQNEKVGFLYIFSCACLYAGFFTRKIYFVFRLILLYGKLHYDHSQRVHHTLTLRTLANKTCRISRQTLANCTWPYTEFFKQRRMALSHLTSEPESSLGLVPSRRWTTQVKFQVISNLTNERTFCCSSLEQACSFYEVARAHADSSE